MELAFTSFKVNKALKGLQIASKNQVVGSVLLAISVILRMRFKVLPSSSLPLMEVALRINVAQTQAELLRAFKLYSNC